MRPAAGETLSTRPHSETFFLLVRFPKNNGNNSNNRFGETGSKLSPSSPRRLQAEKNLKVPVPPLATGPALPFVGEQRYFPQARDVRRRSEGGGARVGNGGAGQLPARRSPYEDEVRG